MSDTLRVSWKQNIIGRKFSSRNVNSVSSLGHYAVESYVSNWASDKRTFLSATCKVIRWYYSESAGSWIVGTIARYGLRCKESREILRLVLPPFWLPFNIRQTSFTSRCVQRVSRGAIISIWGRVSILHRWVNHERARGGIYGHCFD